jgi:hypothetical protein
MIFINYIKKRYAFHLSDTTIEIVNYHLVAIVEVNKPIIAKMIPKGNAISGINNI